MSEYELTEGGVIRTADSLFIPENPILQPWIEYLNFVDAGGVPDPITPVSIGEARFRGSEELARQVYVERRRHMAVDPTQLALDRLAHAQALVADADGSISVGEYPILEAMVPRFGADVAAVAAALLASQASLEASLAAIEVVYQSALESVDTALTPAAVQTVLDGVSWPA